MGANPPDDLGRRALLRKLAAAGAVGWTAPVILSSSPAAAGVFTSKCAPGTVTASASFVQTACTNSGTTLRITIVFAGPCPCGGTKQWCAQKNSPSPVTSTSGTATNLSFVMTGINVPISGSTTVSGRVALGCTDRDGDTQFARYNWSMSASDNGGPCSSANSISGVTLSGRTLITSASCPSLAGFTAAAAPSTQRSTGGGVRPPG